MEKQQREQVDKNIKEAQGKLEAELESAKHEHQLMLMRHGRGRLSVLLTPSYLGAQSQSDRLHTAGHGIWPIRLTNVVFLSPFRSHETSGGAEETRGAPQPGAAEKKADRDEVLVLYRANHQEDRGRTLMVVFYLTICCFPSLAAGMKMKGGGERRR